MSQQLSPWLEGAYGWNFGEGGWNSGMDQNLLKFSFMFDRNVDSITAALPPAVNGQSHYNTTDNRLYFAVGSTYYSTVVPKWFTVIDRSTGATWQYNGSVLVEVENSISLSDRLDSVEVTISSLGSAAFQDTSAFATTPELDIVEAQAQAYTDTLRSDLADDSDPIKGAALIGYLSGTVADALSGVGLSRTVESFGAVGDGLTNDTPALQLAFAWLQANAGSTLSFAPGATYLQGAGTTEVIYEANPYYPARFDITGVDSFKIVGNNATITADPSLADNQFNRGFFFDDCRNFKIENLTYDGRLDARTPFGGDLFNGGNELTGNRKSGFSFSNCQDFRLENVVSKRTMMDGYSYFKYSGSNVTGCHNSTLYNCDGLANYRQGLSIVSGNNNVIIGGSYSNTGTIQGTLPMAGIDIESDTTEWTNTGNIIIGATLANNHTGLWFSKAAQFNAAYSCLLSGNRAYGYAFTSAGACVGNIVNGGRLDQTAASVEVEKYALYIGGSSNKVLNVRVRVADPHRGALFLNLDTTVDNEIIGGEIVDVTPTTAGAFNQILVSIGASTVRCRVRRVSIRDAVGTGQYSVVIDSPTAIFDNNEVRSVHGELGAPGVQVTAANSVTGNSGGGTRITGTADLAVFNISAGATVVQQMGPNIDEANPRTGGKLRRKGFTANVIDYSQSLDLPLIAANSSYSETFVVTGAQLGDIIEVTLASPGDIYAVGRVITTDNVRATFLNPTGAGIDRAVTTLRIKATAP